MPGIFGFTKIGVLKNSKLEKIANEMKTKEHFVQDSFFQNDLIAASRIHLNKVGEKDSPFKSNYLKVWIEGESYNHLDVAEQLGMIGKKLTELLSEAYESNKLNQFLNQLDGYFCAVIYDEKTKKITLISDRYGMRLLYWYEKDGAFAWGSEIKAILACNGTCKKINKAGLKCFMDLGYFLGEDTFFEMIRLIKPATVLTFDLSTRKIDQHYYWTWSEIKLSNLSFEDAVDELGERFLKAVKKRFNPDQSIGISLSGGLDSRAIFAAVNKLSPNYVGYSFTFGVPDCDDIKIAEKTSKLTSWHHESFFFKKDNWFLPRFKNVWDTDGMLDIMHMHGSQFDENVSKDIDINLSGYLGDAIFNTSYQKDNSFKDKKIDHAFITKHFKGHLNKNFLDKFYDISHCEPLLAMNRGRRFINMGIVSTLSSYEQRMPFFDNACIELIFSLPDDYRLNNKLYSLMLKKFFPEFFLKIPWQKTGKPVGIAKNENLAVRFFNRLVRYYMYATKINSNKKYTDYASWIRLKETSIELEKLLKPSSALYRHFLNTDYEKYLKKHQKNYFIDYSVKILRVATLEIYLNQLKAKEFLEIN